MEYEGRICRGPMEAKAFMLPVTVGCPYNRCKFCDLFTDLRYRKISLKDIENELKRVSAHGGNPELIYLGDGSAFQLKADELAEIISLVKRYFPRAATFNSDATITSIKSKSDEELKTLHSLGYNKLYKDLVDQDKDSYQIVLGSNGTVYYVTNYWKGNYDKKAVQTYKVAPDDMQEAYQELLKHYSSASTSESSESSSSSQSSESTSSSSEAKTESKTETKTEQTGMDVNAIKDNNFQSLEGTWKNGNGNSLTFSKDQVTAPTDYEVQNANSSLENGYLRASLRTGMYGAIIFFIPKGTTLPNVSGNNPDASDNTKDRILVTQSGDAQSDAKQFYYKAD